MKIRQLLLLHALVDHLVVHGILQLINRVVKRVRHVVINPLLPFPLPMSPNPHPGHSSRRHPVTGAPTCRPRRQISVSVVHGRIRWRTFSTTFIRRTRIWRGRLQRPVNSNVHLEGRTPAPRQPQRPQQRLWHRKWRQSLQTFGKRHSLSPIPVQAISHTGSARTFPDSTPSSGPI